MKTSVPPKSPKYRQEPTRELTHLGDFRYEARQVAPQGYPGICLAQIRYRLAVAINGSRQVGQWWIYAGLQSTEFGMGLRDLAPCHLAAIQRGGLSISCPPHHAYSSNSLGVPTNDPVETAAFDVRVILHDGFVLTCVRATA